MPRMSYVRRVLGAVLVLFAATFLLATSTSIDAQAPRTVQDGVFSDAQATRGQALYAQRCAGCHGPTLGGAQAPPLTGDALVRNSGWSHCRRYSSRSATRCRLKPQRLRS